MRTIDVAELDDEDLFGRDVSAWINDVYRKRLDLARRHFDDADYLRVGRKYKASITRYYYAMYSACRGVAFRYHKGDDFQKHSDLPFNLPPTMAQKNRWANDLNEARIIRNQCDYEFYPSDEHLMKKANKLARRTRELLEYCNEA